MQKILLIGSGAREDALGRVLKRNEDVELYVWAGSRNPSLIRMAAGYRVGKMDDIDSIVKWAYELAVDFVVIGPELPLSLGVVDALADVGIPSVGPTKAAAQLETSKSFTRELLVDFGIDVCPIFKKCISIEDIEIWMNGYDCGIVVKPDGPTGGKGVRVQGDHFDIREEGLEYARECLEKDGSVLLEEKLIGQEFSLMSFCDGRHLKHMPVVQDNKRLLPDDKGPNTGGMGSISDWYHSLPFLTDEDIRTAQETNQQVADALRELGMEYRGILYGNYIAVKDGIKLIEYNARFGDPEALNVLSILGSDFVEICLGIIEGNLDKADVSFANKATVCKYVVPEGYPENSVRDEKIMVGELLPFGKWGGEEYVGAYGDTPTGEEREKGDGDGRVEVYYAAVDEREEGLYLTGSRAIGVVGIADTITEAEKLAEGAVGKINGPVVHRRDIGTGGLLKKRIDMMRQLRD